MDNKEIDNLLTPKGLALIAAIESGLLPKVEGGWDNSTFNAFWEKYETNLKTYGYMMLLKKDSAKN